MPRTASTPNPAAIHEPVSARTVRHDTATPETLRLALELADACARSDIEMFCCSYQLHSGMWFDTSDVRGGDSEARMVSRAARYLRLRARVLVHPLHPQLVSFPTCP